MTCASCSQILKITKGDNRTLKLTVVDAAGARQDLTGFKIYFTLKKRYEDVTPLISKRSAAAGGDASQIDIVVPQTGAIKGKANIYLLPADTACLELGTYVCDVVIEDLAGVRTTVVAEREVVIGPRVTVLI